MMNEGLTNCRCNSNIKGKFLYEMSDMWTIRPCTAIGYFSRVGQLPLAAVLPSGAVYLFDGP